MITNEPFVFFDTDEERKELYDKYTVLIAEYKKYLTAMEKCLNLMGELIGNDKMFFEFLMRFEIFEGRLAAIAIEREQEM